MHGKGGENQKKINDSAKIQQIIMNNKNQDNATSTPFSK